MPGMDIRATVVPDLPIMRSRGREQRATFFELFFDLVYVFAVTQLSHHLLSAGLTLGNAAQTGLMLAAVYWAWNYTVWMTNWFDPDTAPVRLVLALVMLASLLMAVAIPEGFGGRALLFAAAYVGLQVVRNGFVVAVTPPGDFHRNFVQILVWSLLSAPLWLLGGVLDDLRWPLWLAALALDIAAPLCRFWLPWSGRTPEEHWQIEGAHFTERFELFVIIALGESIVMTGATASQTRLGGGVVPALLLGFVSAFAMWWLYFDCTARQISRQIVSRDITRIGGISRDVYTYLHLPIIAGIVLTAVADQIVIARPHARLTTAETVVTLIGPLIYLVGLTSCLVRIGRPPSWRQLIAVAVLLMALPLALHAPALLVSTGTATVLVALMAVEILRARRRDELAATDEVI